jgi:hypothetical protein
MAERHRLAQSLVAAEDLVPLVWAVAVLLVARKGQQAEVMLIFQELTEARIIIQMRVPF